MSIYGMAKDMPTLRKEERKRRATMKSSQFLLALAVSGAALLGCTGTAHAGQSDTCSARIQKDQRDVNRAIYWYGYNSKQTQHEQDELQRDAVDCGYDTNAYRNYNPASDNGYRDGLVIGERDAERNRAFRPTKNDWYEDADRGYSRAFGDKSSYKYQYRQAFEQGYAEGYQRWRY